MGWRFYVDRALFDAPNRPDEGMEDIAIEYWLTDRLPLLEGDPLENVYLVVGGMVRLCRISSDGRDSSIAILRGGDVVTTSRVSPYQVHPMISTIVARIPHQLFEELRAQNPDFAARIETGLRRRSSLVEDRLAIGHRRTTTRIAHALLEMAAFHAYNEGEAEADDVVIPRPTQDVIASFASTTRVTACNVLESLKRADAVSISSDAIRLNKPLLRRILN